MAAQSVTPSIAEYRAKTEGKYEVRNDSDFAVAVAVEVRGFKVGEDGNLVYAAPEPSLNVRLDADSFIIAPHESHYVFYRASIKNRNAWFAISNKVTRSPVAPNEIRVNFVIPHVVYIYQKDKLKADDVQVRLAESDTDKEYTLEVLNRTTKLGRVEKITSEGFDRNCEIGGFPLFPNGKRRISVQLGTPSNQAVLRIYFQDGFVVSAPLNTVGLAGFQ